MFNYICYHNSLNFSGIWGNSAVLKFLVLKINSNNMFIWKIVHISEKWCKYILKKHTMYLRLSTLNDQHQTYSLKKKKKYWTLKKKSFGLLGKKSTRLTKKKYWTLPAMFYDRQNKETYFRYLRKDNVSQEFYTWQKLPSNIMKQLSVCKNSRKVLNFQRNLLENNLQKTKMTTNI